MPTLALAPRHDTTALPAQPFVKWVGGKGRLLHKLTPMLPSGVELMRHVEPFMGGAALFFAQAPERALLCDVNRSLVRTYEAVRDDVEGVLAELRKLAKAGHDDAAFYKARERYNAAAKKTDREHAALFIFLNKTCFNGLHRVNRRGEFNVPHGKYKNPRIVDEDGLRRASLALSSAELRTTGFDGLLESARPGDFVYFDPPYAPVSDTANFTAYAQDGFGVADQIRLRDVFRELDRRGCRLMLSNSDVPLIRDLYREWNIDAIMAPRAVSASAAGRTAVSEVVVRNY